MKMTGGCLCGQVRYAAEADPLFTSICHCRNCQKQAGTAFSVLVAVPRAAIAIEGNVKTFHDRGDSGKPVQRRFCPECGSPIATEVATMPDITFIMAGTLDDTSWLSPSVELFCDSAQPWVALKGELKRFARMPS
jgi:hypothetical protein